MKQHGPRTNRQHASAGFGIYESNDLDTVIRRGDGNMAHYFIVTGSARATMHRETERVRRRLALSILGRWLFALTLTTITVMTVIAVLSPGSWADITSALAAGNYFITFWFAAVVIVTAMVTVGVFFATTSWSRRWRPDFGGFNADHHTGLLLFLDLTPNDRDRLLQAMEVSPAVLERAIDLLYGRYSDAREAKWKAERERERSEAARLMNDRS